MSSLNAIKNSKHHFTRIIQSLQKLIKLYVTEQAQIFRLNLLVILYHLLNINLQGKDSVCRLINVFSVRWM